jgi:cell division septation protein DedD
MPNSFKNTWWIYLLIVAGGIILLLSLRPNKPQGDQGVVLNDLFHQQVAATESGVPSNPPKKSDPVPPLAIVTSPVDGREAGFTIQVYSFQDKNRAETALQTLKNSGYQAFMIMSDLGEKGIWYRVRIGGIADEAVARKMLEDIRKNYNSGFILKPKN